MTSLAKSSAGEVGIVCEEGARRHLAELGFVVRKQVAVVGKPGGGMILSVKDSGMALDVTMTERIMGCGRRRERL